jgi:hypothetical protein
VGCKKKLEPRGYARHVEVVKVVTTHGKNYQRYLGTGEPKIHSSWRLIGWQCIPELFRLSGVASGAFGIASR